MSDQHRNAARIGRAAEHYAIAWLLRNHRLWVTQMADSSSIDLLVQHQDNTQFTMRVQVKSCFRIGKRRVVNLTKTNGQRYRQDVDVLLAVDMQDQLVYVLPMSVLKNRGRLTLGPKFSGYAYQWDESTVWFDLGTL